MGAGAKRIAALSRLTSVCESLSLQKNIWEADHMLVIESVIVGSQESQGLFSDWVRQLEPYVSGGHSSFSPHKYIHAEYRGLRLGGGRFIRQQGNGPTVSAFSPQGKDRAKLNPVMSLQIAGQTSIHQHGRECTLMPGEFAFFDLSRPCEIQRSGDWETLAIQFPSSSFQPLAFQGALVVPMQAQSQTDGLLYNAACGFWEAAQMLDHRSHGLVFDTLRSLASMTSAFNTTSEVKSNVRVDRAKVFIEQMLDDENLSAGVVAEAQGISRRHLDNCFTQIGPSIDAYIWERRLARAAEMLSQSCLADQTLLQISLDLGFKGPSHFSKAFRNRFGVSPRTYRQNSLKEKMSEPH